MGQTTNYQFSWWDGTDRILMEDFNADNAKVDAALKAEAEARQAAGAAEAAARAARTGNCQIYTTSYVGTGKWGTGGPNSVTFPTGLWQCFL